MILQDIEVWADTLPPNVITQIPVLVTSELNVGKVLGSGPEVELFPVCAVTRAMACRNENF